MTRLLCVGLYVSLFETAHDTWLPAPTGFGKQTKFRTHRESEESE